MLYVSLSIIIIIIIIISRYVWLSLDREFERRFRGLAFAILRLLHTKSYNITFKHIYIHTTHILPLQQQQRHTHKTAHRYQELGQENETVHLQKKKGWYSHHSSRSVHGKIELGCKNHRRGGERLRRHRSLRQTLRKEIRLEVRDLHRMPDLERKIHSGNLHESDHQEIP